MKATLPPPLLLASSSPRRREILESLGLAVQVLREIPFHERPERENVALSPSELAWYNALGKALAAARLHPDRPLLAADTIVSFGARVFGKPADRQEAEATLAFLSGKTHVVQTAYVLVFPAPAGERPRFTGDVERTEVTFRRLTPEIIARYLDAVPVRDKAGSYAIQERGDDLVASIRGSYSNVVGLPIEAVSRLLRQAGYYRGSVPRPIPRPGPASLSGSNLILR